MPLIPPFLWPFRKFIGIGLGSIALVALLLWYRGSLIEDGKKIGRDAAMALWAADTLKRDAADEEARAKDAADQAAALANNVEVTEHANQALIAIAADRDSLAARLRNYENRLRSLAASQATDQRGLDVAAGIASRAEEADRLYDAYDKACQRDAVRYQALIDELRPQL